MNGATKGLAQALEADWRQALDAMAAAQRFPGSAEVAALAAQVRGLSNAYNDAPISRVATSRGALAARLGFSFARDVPKSAAAVAELILASKLRLEASEPLQVLDVGAGLGATTWGLARALAASGARGIVSATWVDEDPAALALGAALVKTRGGVARAGASVKVTARTEVRSAATLGDLGGPYDVIALGQVLSELDPGEADDARLARHVAWVEALLGRLRDHGSLVIVEPALRARTRHLHRLRDALLARQAATVFAPCLHAAPCPALAAAGDWCHEDRAVDLPPWLWPVARAAGLRWQGLTFSYLVLRRDGETLAGALDRHPARLRVVSAPQVSKGKRELFLCGVKSRASDATEDAGRWRVTRLDRDRSEANGAWDLAARGDLLGLDPAPASEKPRVDREGTVVPLAPRPPPVG